MADITLLNLLVRIVLVFKFFTFELDVFFYFNVCTATEY